MEDLYIKAISTLIGMLLVAYGFIFRSVLLRIKKTEDDIELVERRKPEHSCIYPNLNNIVEEVYNTIMKRIEKIEKEQADTRPILVDIRTRLMEVHTDIQWLKKNDHRD